VGSSITGFSICLGRFFNWSGVARRGWFSLVSSAWNQVGFRWFSGPPCGDCPFCFSLATPD